MRTRGLLWLIYALGALALFVGPYRFDRTIVHALRPLDAAPVAHAFRSPGAYPTTDSSGLPKQLGVRGSWIDGDEFQGRDDSPWYTARRHVVVLLCGYPALAPNRLEIEYRRHDASLGSVPYVGENPAETWRPWEVALPADATTFRIRAVDGSSDLRGWLAFSDPFVDLGQPIRRWWPVVQIITTTCLSLVLLYGPGLWWLARKPFAAHKLALAIVPGPLLVASLGLACWALGGVVAPLTLARFGLIALLIAIGVGFLRCRPNITGYNARVIGVGALLAFFAVAKASLSLGPEGELFAGTVSRTLEVGGHSDSRNSFHIVQLVGAHAGPFSKEAEALFSPWSIANRGPVAGLLAAPVVLATGGEPTADACWQPWQPFDPQGFAAYRITQIVLASLCAWAVFGAVAVLTRGAWGFLAANIVLLSPFFVHEMYFTWPKLAAAGGVLAAFVLAYERRPFLAGLGFGLAYLFHPLALLVLPFFGAWVLSRELAAHDWRRPNAPSMRARVNAALRCLVPPLLFSLGVLPFVVGWMSFSQLAPLRTGTQTVFFDYFRLSDNQLISHAGPWWHARWENFANTFVPLHLFTVDRAHESINSVYGRSGPWVQAAFLYWNTLPFALGLPAFALLFAGLAAAARRAPGTALLTYFLPTLLLVIYWGAACTGVMRHCGHVLFVSTIVLGVWGLARHAAGWRWPALSAFLHPAWFAWRGFEVALVGLGTTLLHQRPQLSGPHGETDLFFLLTGSASLLAAIAMVAITSQAAAAEAFGEPPRHADVNSAS